MDHLRAVWRISLAFGAIRHSSTFNILLPPENERPRAICPRWDASYQDSILACDVKRHWARLVPASIIWFIYDFSAYSFGIYSSTILDGVFPEAVKILTLDVDNWRHYTNLSDGMWPSYFLFLPGAAGGAYVSDYLGPRYTLAIGVFLQAIFGFIISGLYDHLSRHVSGFYFRELIRRWILSDFRGVRTWR